MFSVDTTVSRAETRRGGRDSDSDIHFKAANHILNNLRHEGCLSEIDYLTYKKKLADNLKFDEINDLMNNVLLNCGQITQFTDWFRMSKLERDYNISDQLIMERQEEAKLLTPPDIKMSLSPISFNELFPKNGIDSDTIRLKINWLTIKLNWLIISGILGKEDAYSYINKLIMTKDYNDDKINEITNEIRADCGQNRLFFNDNRMFIGDGVPLQIEKEHALSYLANPFIPRMPALHDYKFYKSSFPFFKLKSEINKGSDNTFPPAIVNMICDYLITFHMMNLAMKEKNYCGLRQGFLLTSNDSKNNNKDNRTRLYEYKRTS